MPTKKSKSSSSRRTPFAQTQWSLILRAQEGNTPTAQNALEQLCRSYWYPLYGFVRRCGYDPAGAQDLTQDFFVRLTAKNFFDHVDPSKGKFRSFLLASLKNFLSNDRARSQAAKRGGGQALISLDSEMAENRFKSEPSLEATPENAFDRTWATTVLEDALSELKREYASRGNSSMFEALQPYLCGDRDEPGYAALAGRLTTTEAAIKMAVVRLRRRFGQLLRAKVRQTV